MVHLVMMVVVRECSWLLSLFGDVTIGKCVDVCSYPYYADETQLFSVSTCSFYIDSSGRSV